MVFYLCHCFLSPMNIYPSATPHEASHKKWPLQSPWSAAGYKNTMCPCAFCNSTDTIFGFLFSPLYVTRPYPYITYSTLPTTPVENMVESRSTRHRFAYSLPRSILEFSPILVSSFRQWIEHLDSLSGLLVLPQHPVCLATSTEHLKPWKLSDVLTDWVPREFVDDFVYLAEYHLILVGLLIRISRWNLMRYLPGAINSTSMSLVSKHPS